jgi:hypothetical protein
VIEKYRKFPVFVKFNHWDQNQEALVDGFEYLKVDLYYDLKSYRLILVLPTHLEYIGVRSIFRIKKGGQNAKSEA